MWLTPLFGGSIKIVGNNVEYTEQKKYFRSKRGPNNFYYAYALITFVEFDFKNMGRVTPEQCAEKFQIKKFLT